MENNERIEASEALDAIRATRSDLADRLVTPWFYHPVLAALMAGMALVYGLDQFRDSSLRFLYAMLVIVAGLGLTRLYAALTGVVLGRPAGRRSGLMLAILALGLVVPLLFLIIAEPGRDVVLGVAGFMFVFTIVAGRAYDAGLRADLRAGATR